MRTRPLASRPIRAASSAHDPRAHEPLTDSAVRSKGCVGNEARGTGPPTERGVSGRLDFARRDDDPLPRLLAAEWPRSVRFSKYKVSIMETTGILERGGYGIRRLRRPRGEVALEYI